MKDRSLNYVSKHTLNLYFKHQEQLNLSEKKGYVTTEQVRTEAGIISGC